MEQQALAGRTIAVPESRELEVFATLLERRGAHVLRCPLITILDAPDPEPVLAFARALANGALDDFILLTGEGLTRLINCVRTHEPALEAPFLKSLAALRKITRGPKPARALRQLDLTSDVAADPPTTAGVVAALSLLDLKGRRVGVQLYGSEPNSALMRFLQEAGAAVRTVAPYVYGNASDDAAVRALLTRLSQGEVDAIAFTSTPQVERLFAVAPAEEVRRALGSTQVAAVGPVVRATLERHGVATQLTPEASFFLKPLTTLLEAALKS
jgi:uroporphyrinogen-III synthase